MFRLIFVWTGLWEGLTCLLRFGAELQSTRDSASTIGLLTMGLRIHHSYVGMAMIPVAFLLEQKYPRASRWMVIVGMSLFLSDMIHHFGVLWFLTGSPQFDLFY